MLISYKRGQGSIVLRVKLLNSSVATGAGLAGLTSASSGLIISTIADNEATATAYTVAGSLIESITTLGTYAAPTATKVRFKEVDATNHKGVYEIQIADARFAVSSAKSLIVSLSGATNLAETDVTVPLLDINPYDAVRAGLTALPNAAAEAAGGLFTRGAGAGQINQDANGRVDVSLKAILGTTLTETAGQIAAAFRQFFNIASPTSTMNTITLTSTTTTLTNAPSDSSGVTTLLGKFTGITLLAQWLGLLAGKQVGNSTARTEVRATGAGSGTFDETTDSQEALRDRGDAAYTTATGFAVAGDIMKVSSGTGANQLDVTSGVVKANLAQILGTALTETAGQIAAAFKKFFNIATPASTMDALTLVATATTVTNRVTANADQIAGDSTAATNLKTSFNDTAGPVPWLGIMDQGTAQAATATTLQLRSAATFADDTILGAVVAALGSTQGYWQVQQITDYVGSTDTATVPGWQVTPSGTITYKVFSVPQGVAISAADLALIAAAVADLNLTGHTTSGSAGAAWTAAGGAGDPWSTLLPGSYGAGTAGKMLSDMSTNVSALVTRITSTLFANITSMAQWLGLIAGKQTGNTTARTELRATGAGSGTFDETTDSQEALRDRGDAAWTPPSASTVATAVAAQVTTDHGSGSYIRNTEPLDAAATRAALGMATNNLDTQLDTLPTAIENADALLARNAKGGSTGAANVSVAAAIAGGFMKFSISGTTLTIDYADGTPAITRTLSRAQLDAIVASA